MPIPSKAIPAVPKTARERVYTQLKQWIIDGTMKPDEKISDTELAEYFSVSRTPVREAMQMLADQKLIKIYPGKESRISKIDITQARKNYIIISQLYVMAIEFAFSDITESDIAALKEINNHFLAALNSHDSVNAHKYDRQFHSYFLEIVPNDFLSDFIDTLDCHVERVETVFFNDQKGVQSLSATQHDAIISALEKRDLEQAVEQTRNNWLHTLKCIPLNE